MEQAKSGLPNAEESDSTIFHPMTSSLSWQFVHGLWIIAAVFAFIVMTGSIRAFMPAVQQGALIHNDGNIVNNPAANPSSVAVAGTFVAGLILHLIAAICFTMAVLLFWQKRSDRMVLFVSYYLLWAGVVHTSLLEFWEFYVPGIASFTTDFLMTAVSPILNIILMAIFPNGRFVPPWTRWIVLYSILLMPIPIVAYFNSIEFYDSNFIWVLFILWVVPTFTALYAQIYRYRNVSGQIERQQAKWIIYGLALTILLNALSGGPYYYMRNLPEGATPQLWIQLFGIFTYFPSVAIIPLVLTIAVLRFRLWDVDIIINRTLVYAVLTAMVVGIYVVVVGALGVIFHASSSLPISLFATGIVAVLFQPLRERLQQSVNHLFYGDRNEPYAVLERLSERLDLVVQTEQVLPTIVETVAHALKLPYVAITFLQEQKFEIVAQFPQDGEWLKEQEHTEVLLLVYQSELVGQLILAPRRKGELFSQMDRQLLETIARQTSIAAYNVRLTDELQRSREELVNAREEERRRLRRDLHDGLGPILATISVGMDSIQYLANKPEILRKISQDLKSQALSALNDIRRIAYNLRPPALDELGLVAALKQYVDANNHSNGLYILFEAPANLPELPAAVELAAYRIVLEAVNNVQRHAQATRCHVRMSCGSYLYLEIIDDGSGMPPSFVSGIGLNSMRERASELGGYFAIKPLKEDSGTIILAQLPLPENLQEEAR